MHAGQPHSAAPSWLHLVAIDGERVGMSWQACKAIADLQIPAHPDAGKGGFSSPAVAKSVLWPIAEAASPEGAGVTLSVSTIARRAQLGRTAVLGGLKLLEWSGVITRKPRFRDGGRTSDEISLNPELMARLGSVGEPPSPPRGPGVVRDADHGNPRAAPQEPVPEPKDERERAPARLKQASEGKPMSPTWEPPEDAYDFGASIDLTSREVEQETAKFRDWHLARKHTSLSADWPATWRLWMRRAADRKEERSSSGLAGGPKSTAADAKRWSGPDEVLDVVAGAGVTEWYLATYFSWRELPELALVTQSATAFDKLRSCERSLREAGWKLLRLERAA